MTDITKRLAEALAESTYGLERALAGKRIVNADEIIEHGKQVLQAYDAQAGKASGWQPIEAAPKNSDVLLYCQSCGVVRGKWKDDRYAKTPRPYWSHDRERLFGVRSTRDDQPTHWMPLPDPPEQST